MRLGELPYCFELYDDGIIHDDIGNELSNKFIVIIYPYSVVSQR